MWTCKRNCPFKNRVERKVEYEKQLLLRHLVSSLKRKVLQYPPKRFGVFPDNPGGTRWAGPEEDIGKIGVWEGRPCQLPLNRMATWWPNNIAIFSKVIRASEETVKPNKEEAPHEGPLDLEPQVELLVHNVMLAVILIRALKCKSAWVLKKVVLHTSWCSDIMSLRKKVYVQVKRMLPRVYLEQSIITAE